VIEPRDDHRGAIAARLDLTGTFAFALNGSLTALRTARLDIFAVTGASKAKAIT
jgi:uncharacterized membrane protein YeiH